MLQRQHQAIRHEQENHLKVIQAEANKEAEK